jgi:hypothetical protein
VIVRLIERQFPEGSSWADVTGGNPDSPHHFSKKSAIQLASGLVALPSDVTGISWETDVADGALAWLAAASSRRLRHHLLTKSQAARLVRLKITKKTAAPPRTIAIPKTKAPNWWLTACVTGWLTTPRI